MSAASSSSLWFMRMAGSVGSVVLLLSVMLLTPAPGALAQDQPGGAISTWSVVPEARAVDVEIVYDRSNDFEGPIGGVFETLPSTAVDVTAVSRAGASLEVIPFPDAGDFAQWFVAFDRPVDPGGTFSWTLRYRIPSDRPDAVVHAFVDLAVVWVSSFAVDDTGPGGPVRHRVEVPVDYEIDGSSSFGGLRVEGETRIFESPTLDAYEPFVVFAENSSARETGLAVEGVPEFVFSSLPSDPTWPTRTTSRVTALAGALAEVFAAALPSERVRVVEVLDSTVRHASATRTLDGSTDAWMALSAGAPTEEVAHQLAHLWLLDSGIADFWFEEGLAYALAGAAGVDLGYPFVADLPTRADLAADAPPLLVWASGATSMSLPVDAEGDRFGAVASFLVVDTVLDEIGLQAMREVIAALSADTITYVGRPVPEPQPIFADWRVSLDALTEIGGSERAVDLFAEFVVGDDERPLLDRWRDARSTWDALVERADGWAMPLSLRRPMAAWEFAAADAAAADIGLALDRRDEIAEVAEEVDLAVPDATRDAFERADSETFEMVSAMLDGQIDHAARVVAAVRVSHADHGLLADVGLFGEDADVDLERVRFLWTAGDTEAAAEAADELVDLLDGAAGRGTIRIIIPFAVVALVVAAWNGLRRRRHGPSDLDELEAGAVGVTEEQGGELRGQTRPHVE